VLILWLERCADDFVTDLPTGYTDLHSQRHCMHRWIPVDIRKPKLSYLERGSPPSLMTFFNWLIWQDHCNVQRGLYHWQIGDTEFVVSLSMPIRWSLQSLGVQVLQSFQVLSMLKRLEIVAWMHDVLMNFVNLPRKKGIPLKKWWSSLHCHITIQVQHGKFVFSGRLWRHIL
jgi:hypothetical protein